MAWEQGSKWRRFVLDANDGIVATAGLVEGLVGAGASTGSTRLAAAASLIAGSLSILLFAIVAILLVDKDSILFVPVAPPAPGGALFSGAAERAYLVLGCLIGAERVLAFGPETRLMLPGARSTHTIGCREVDDRWLDLLPIVRNRPIALSKVFLIAGEEDLVDRPVVRRQGDLLALA